MSGYHPALDALAEQYNKTLLAHGLSLDSSDERSGGLDLFMLDSRQTWVPVSRPGDDNGPMRFWPPITVVEILAWVETNRPRPPLSFQPA
jgi:hypothetical protein